MVERPAAAGTHSESDYESLAREYGLLNEQFAAAKEVLTAVARSAGDPDTVLTTIVESVRRLCRSDQSQLYLLDDRTYRLIKTSGMSEESIAYIAAHPIPVDRATLIGRIGLERATQQIEDVLVDPEYGRRDLQEVAGFRTTMGAPMMLDGEVIGVLNVWREQVRPFDEREMDIAAGFAGQAAIAINGAFLVQELQKGRTELARKVEELEALREVGEAVGSSLDVSHVLATIAKHAVELSETDGGSIMEYDPDERRFIVRSVYRTEQSVIDRLCDVRIDLDGTLVGRAAKERRPLAVTDLGAQSLDPHLQILYAALITRHAEAVGHRLAREGALGRFAVDFVVVKDSAGQWSAYAIELNLRKGGTTHPFLTLQFLTDGRYDPTTALFVTPKGQDKHLVATDHLESELLRGLLPADLFDVVARHGLHFDHSRQVGVVFHMISCLTEHGRVGLTAVGDTPADASERYREAERVLLEEARLSLMESPLTY